MVPQRLIMSLFKLSVERAAKPVIAYIGQD
jgi:hypothetical protein